MSRKLCLQALIVVIGLTVLSFSASAQQNCGRLKAWAEQNVAFLPHTYEGLAEYPVQYRRAIFSTAEPELKSQLWREHLEHYLAANPNLTPEQQEVLTSAIDLADPVLFSIGRKDPRWNDLVNAPLADLMQRARPLFSAQELSRIFEQLGGAESQKPGKPVASLPTKFIQCSCSTASDYCGSGYRCVAANCDQVGGCGTFWAYTCNGLCFK